VTPPRADCLVFLAELALKHRLPTIFGTRDNVLAGGLMSYSADHIDLTRRAVVYIDKIHRQERSLVVEVLRDIAASRLSLSGAKAVAPPNILLQRTGSGSPG